MTELEIFKLAKNTCSKVTLYEREHTDTSSLAVFFPAPKKVKSYDIKSTQILRELNPMLRRGTRRTNQSCGISLCQHLLSSVPYWKLSRCECIEMSRFSILDYFIVARRKKDNFQGMFSFFKEP